MTISVITTTFNRVEYLEEMIRSVQLSVFTPLNHQVQLELIIYDDGSTDKTFELMGDPRFDWVKYIRSDENNGPSFGRNLAIKSSTGEYIFILDSDDVILQRTLYQLVSEFVQDPKLGWIETDFIRADKDLKYRLDDDYFGWKFQDKEQMLASIFKGEHYIQGNVMFTRKIFDEVGGYDNDIHMGEDLDLYTRFLLAGYFPLYKPIISHIHRMHETNLSKDSDMSKHLVTVEALKLKYQISNEKI